MGVPYGSAPWECPMGVPHWLEFPLSGQPIYREVDVALYAL